MPITQEKFNKRFCELLGSMQDIVVKKSHDYSGSEDALSNLSMCEKAGIPAWIGVASVRMADKMSRILNFCKSGTLKVKDESIKDTLIDLANYCLIAYIAYENANQTDTPEQETPKKILLVEKG